MFAMHKKLSRRTHTMRGNLTHSKQVRYGHKREQENRVVGAVPEKTWSVEWHATLQKIRASPRGRLLHEDYAERLFWWPDPRISVDKVGRFMWIEYPWDSDAKDQVASVFHKDQKDLCDLLNVEALFLKGKAKPPRQASVQCLGNVSQVYPVAVRDASNLCFWVDPRESFFGIYLDQMAARTHLQSLAREGDTVLNLFSYTGAFPWLWLSRAVPLPVWIVLRMR